jgi:hypothetical protein
MNALTFGNAQFCLGQVMAQSIMTNPITDQLNELRDNKAKPCLTVQSCNAAPYPLAIKDQLGAQQGQGIEK